MRILYSLLKNKRKGENSLRLKASITVESALVLPLFFLTITVLAGMLDLYRTGILIQSALCEGAKELGMYAYCRDGEAGSPVGIVDSSVCAVYGAWKVREKLKGEQLSGIQGGINGISLLGSKWENGIIILHASFFYKSPVSFLQMFPVKIEICGQARAWTGYHGETYGGERTEELVYITDFESVYHTSEECTHLELTVHSVSPDSIGTRRNIYGEEYYPCERCADSEETGAYVYITDTGNKYHTDAACGGVIRHVKAVKKSEIQNLQPCNRCGGN